MPQPKKRRHDNEYERLFKNFEDTNEDEDEYERSLLEDFDRKDSDVESVPRQQQYVNPKNPKDAKILEVLKKIKDTLKTGKNGRDLAKLQVAKALNQKPNKRIHRVVTNYMIDAGLLHEPRVKTPRSSSNPEREEAQEQESIGAHLDKFLAKGKFDAASMNAELKLLKNLFKAEETAHSEKWKKLTEQHESLSAIEQHSDDPEVKETLKSNIDSLAAAIRDMNASFKSKKETFHKAESHIYHMLRALQKSNSVVTPEMKSFFKQNLNTLSNITKIEDRLQNLDNSVIDLNEKLTEAIESNASEDELKSIISDLEAQESKRDKARAKLEQKIKPYTDKQNADQFKTLLKQLDTGAEGETPDDDAMADKLAAVTKAALKSITAQLTPITAQIPASSQIVSDVSIVMKRISEASTNMRKLAAPYQKNDVIRTAILSISTLFNGVADQLLDDLQNRTDEKTAAPTDPNPIAERRQNRPTVSPKTTVVTQSKRVSDQIQKGMVVVFNQIPNDAKLLNNIRTGVTFIVNETKKLTTIGKKYEDDYPDLQYALQAVSSLLSGSAQAVLNGMAHT